MTYLYDLFVRIAERHEEATLWEKARPTGRKSHHAHDGTMNLCWLLGPSVLKIRRFLQYDFVYATFW